MSLKCYVFAMLPCQLCFFNILQPFQISTQTLPTHQPGTFNLSKVFYGKKEIGYCTFTTRKSIKQTVNELKLKIEVTEIT